MPFQPTKCFRIVIAFCVRLWCRCGEIPNHELALWEVWREIQPDSNARSIDWCFMFEAAPHCRLVFQSRCDPVTSCSATSWTNAATSELILQILGMNANDHPSIVQKLMCPATWSWHDLNGNSVLFLQFWNELFPNSLASPDNQDVVICRLLPDRNFTRDLCHSRLRPRWPGNTLPRLYVMLTPAALVQRTLVGCSCSTVKNASFTSRASINVSICSPPSKVTHRQHPCSNVRWGRWKQRLMVRL